MEAMIGILPANDVTIKCEASSDVFVDEIHVKAEIAEEGDENITASNHQDETFNNTLKDEEHGSSKYVYCDICWICFKDAEALKEHLLANSECKQFNRGESNVNINDSKSKIYLHQQYSESAPCTNLTISESCSDLTSFAEPNKVISTVKSDLAVVHHICEVCNQSFTRKDNLKRHRLLHTGSKPTSDYLTHNVNLNEHNKLPTMGKAFSCDVCNKLFTRKEHLNNHKRKHTGEKANTCDICNQSFTRKEHLKIHQRLHTGEKPFLCDICNRPFTEKGTLNKHKRRHTGEKPFSCDVCNRCFTQRGSLVIHKRKHSGGELFSCDVCQQSFTHKGNLNVHKRKHTIE